MCVSAVMCSAISENRQGYDGAAKGIQCHTIFNAECVVGVRKQ